MDDSLYEDNARYMRAVRTTTEDEVHERARQHDAHDLTAQERGAQFNG